jgi:hypothetical protein
MATNFRDKADNASNTAASLLRTAVGVSPLIAAAYMSGNAFKANAAINIPVASSDPIKTLERKIANEAKAIGTKDKAAREKASAALVERFQKELQSSDTLKKVFADADQKNSLIHSLMLMIDDPGLGLAENARSTLKTKLFEMNNTGMNENAAVEDITKILKTVAQNPDVVEKWTHLRSQYSDIGTQLRPAMQAIPSQGAAYNIIPTNLSRLQQGYVGQLQRGLGKGFDVEAVSYKEVTGEGSSVARIYEKVGGSRRFRGTVPLSDTLYRQGESGRTLRTMPKGVLDFGQIHKNPTAPLGRAYRTTQSHFVQDIVKRARAGHVDWSDAMEYQRQFLANVSRGAGTATYGQRHVLNQSLLGARRLALVNIEGVPESELGKTYARMATGYNGLFDAGMSAKSQLYRSSQGMMGNVNFARGSLHDIAQQNFGWMDEGTNVIDRSFMPLTAREYQQSGRIDYFTGGFERRGNLIYGSVLNALESTGEPLGKAAGALGAGRHATGTLGAAVMFDLGGKLSKSGIAGEGMSFTGRSRQVVRQLQKTILNPEGQHMSSEALDRIVKGGAAGATFTRDELRAGVYLGEGAAGKINLPWNEGTHSLNVRLNDATTAQIGKNTKKELSFAIDQVQEMTSFKGFSPNIKGNVEVTDDILRWETKPVGDMWRSFAQRKNLDLSSMIRSDSKMLKKGHMNMLNQITGGAMVVTNGELSIDAMRIAASSLASGGGPILGVAKGTSRNQRTLGAYTQAIMTQLHARGVGAQDIGLVVSGVYWGAEGQGKHGLPKTAIAKFAKGLFGDKASYRAFMETIAMRQAIGYEMIAKGESSGEWGRARLGVDHRFARTLQERLMLDVGMDADNAANVTSRVLSNKVGLAQHYRSAMELSTMVDYAKGGTTALNYMTSKAERLSFDDLITKGMLHEGGLTKYLEQSQHGVVVDFSNAKQSVKAAMKHSELYLPGKEMFEAMKGTVLKTQEGHKELSGPFGELIHSLQGRLLAHQNDTGALRTSMAEWQENLVKMFASTTKSVYAGKIKGAMAPTAKGFDLSAGFGVGNEAQRIRAGEVTLKSRSPVGFLEGTGFMSHLHDARGTLSDKELAVRAQRFFTSMEHGKAKNSYVGLSGAFTREPQLATGNVQLGQIFRDLREVTALGGKDTTFDVIKGSEVGRRLLTQHFEGQMPNSFADPRMRTRQAHGFFQDLVKNISSFSSGENSGGIWFPMMKDKGGNAIGAWTQAIGDVDGDHAGTIFFDQKTASSIHKATRGQVDAMAAREFRGRQIYNSFEGQIKGAINSMIDPTLKMSAAQQATEDIMKEVNLSLGTGRIDTALRPAHEALWRYEGDALNKHVGRTFLGAIQEHLVIKSKNLAKYSDMPSQIEASFRRWTQHGTDEAFQETRSLLHNIFKGQDIATKGISLSAVELQTEDDALKQMWAKTYGSYNEARTFNLDDILNTLHGSIKKSVAAGTNVNLTQGQLAGAFSDDPVEVMNSLRASGVFGDFVPSGQQAVADASNTLSAVQRMGSKMDSHMTGKLALGALASAGVFGMLGGGMSPEPIIMPGEQTSGAVMGGIASGNLFNRRDADVSPEQMVAPGNQYDRMAPINTGTAYAARPNSYQIRGEVGTGSGLASFSSYFNQLTGGTGRGVITINDQRRPITRNYVDRLLGEY